MEYDAQADYSHELYNSDYADEGKIMLENSMTLNSSTINRTSEDQMSDASRLAEAAFLFGLAALGMALNAIVIASVILCSRLRRLTNAFIVHGGLVDAARSALCLPYGLSALRGGGHTPADCDTLGTVEVVALSVSMFNLLAMVLTEAYTFHVHNMDEFDTDRRGAVLCVLFGVSMVYAAGLIIHLGPTLIGGHFQYAQGVGSCAFRDYVLQAIWVAIVTLTIALVFVYIVKFYRQLKANDDFRVRVLGRTMAAYSKSVSANPNYFNVIQALKKRIKVLATIAASFIVCFYPFFFLTLADRHLEQPKVYYKILTYLSWSQAAIAPLVFIACDGSLGLVCSIRSCYRGEQGSGLGTPKTVRENSRQPLTALTRDSSYAVSFADKMAQRPNGNRDRGGMGAAYAWTTAANDEAVDDDDSAEAGLMSRTRSHVGPTQFQDSDETAI